MGGYPSTARRLRIAVMLLVQQDSVDDQHDTGVHSGKRTLHTQQHVSVDLSI